jgi:hypothetical protein
MRNKPRKRKQAKKHASSRSQAQTRLLVGTGCNGCIRSYSSYNSARVILELENSMLVGVMRRHN